MSTLSITDAVAVLRWLARNGDHSIRAMQDRFQISRSTVFRWLVALRRAGLEARIVEGQVTVQRWPFWFAICGSDE